MNQILQILYDQIVAKLDDDGISIDARNVLVDIKKEMAEMLKEEFTLDTLPGIEEKMEGFIDTIEKLKLKDKNCLEQATTS